MLDFANAYTTFASLGYKKDLYFIEKILDNEGNVIYSHEPTNNLVLNPNFVYILNLVFFLHMIHRRLLAIF